MRFRLPGLLAAATLLLAPSHASSAQPPDDNVQACLKLGYQVIQHIQPWLDKIGDGYVGSFDRTDAAAKTCGIYARAVPVLRSMRCPAGIIDVMDDNFTKMRNELAALNDKYESAFNCYATDSEWGSVQYENVDSFRGQ